MKFLEVVLALFMMGLPLAGQAQTVDARYIGVFVPVRNEVVNAVVDGRAMGQYLPLLVQAHRHDAVQLATVQAEIYLQSGNEKVVLFRGQIDGNLIMPMDRAHVGPSTSLCVEVDAAWFAAPVCRNDINAIFDAGHSRDQREAVGLVVIAPQ